MTSQKRDSLRPFWTSQRALLIALALSAFAHVATYFASHDWVSSWRGGNAAQDEAGLRADLSLNAVLLPSASNIETDPPGVSAVVAKPKTIRSRSAAPRVVTKSAATFAAPENAIAVAATTNANDEMGTSDAPAITLADAASNTINERANLPAASATTAATTAATANSNAPATTSLNATAQNSPPAESVNTIPPVVFPEKISMAYRISSSVADGIADFSWKRNGTNYELSSTIQATGIFVGLFVGTFRQTSRGEMTPDGIRPRFFSMQRGETPADTAEFNRGKSELKIIKHGETHLFPLPPRMQDTQSFLFQLAQDAYKFKTPDDRVKVALTNARKLYDYQFRLIGEETLQTRMGTLTTLHVKSDAADPEDAYEVWLSPKHYYLPVKAKFYMGRFLVEQTVTSISASDP